jgi:uncharacterized protein (TIGR03086 family)
MMAEPVNLSQLGFADRHRSVAARFGSLVRAGTDWTAPSPVSEWTAGDVVRHLIDWFPAFLEAGGVEADDVTPASSEGLADAWDARAAAIQALLDDDAIASSSYTHPFAGTHELGTAIDRFYTADVFMHTWDLARATGGDDRLDPAWSAEMLSGMRPIEELLRSSGHYGPGVEVDEDAEPIDRLMGFIGRDPNWTAE